MILFQLFSKLYLKNDVNKMGKVIGLIEQVNLLNFLFKILVCNFFLNTVLSVVFPPVRVLCVDQLVLLLLTTTRSLVLLTTRSYYNFSQVTSISHF